MKIKFRTELETDHSATESLTREAFWNQYTPGCNEHYLVHIMRNSKTFVPELDIVAVDGEKVVANIMYLKSVIIFDNVSMLDVLSLGPVSVLPEYQKKGIGGLLIRHTKYIAQQMNFAAILLCGDPSYYSRHGFVPAEKLGIRTSDGHYLDALQICVLNESAMPHMTGRYFEDEVYGIDEIAVSKFDSAFPSKEKISGTPSQLRFQQLAGKYKKAK